MKAKSRPYNESSPPAIVLGLGQNGLASVRSLGRLGIPVFGVDSDLRQPTARSRYCRTVALPPKATGDQLIEALVKLGPQLSQKGVLFPSGDNQLETISEHRNELQAFYHLTCPSREVVRLTLNKQAFYEFARKHEFALPATHFYLEPDELHKAAEELKYPCIIKPFQPNRGWRKNFPDNKLFRVESTDELLSTYKRLFSVHQDLIVQECITGKESNLWFSLGYWNREGQALGLFTGRKIRQYPPHFGTSSVAESFYNRDVEAETSKIIAALGYQGYGSIEFKWDEQDRVLKVIEVTARTWFPHGISPAAGLNLLHIAYCDSTGQALPAYDGFTDGLKWIHEERDLRSALLQVRNGDITIGEWLRSYSGKRTYALTALDDPGVIAHLLAAWALWPVRRVKRMLG